MAHRVQSAFGSSPSQSILNCTCAASRSAAANHSLWPLLALFALVLPACGGGSTAPAPPQQPDPLAISSVSGITEGAELSGTVELAMAVSGGTGTPALTMATASAVIAHGAGTTLSLNWDTTQLADGAYQVCFLASDNEQQTATRAFQVTIDNSAPADGGGDPGGDDPAPPEPDEPAPPPPAFGGAIPLIAASTPVAGDAPPQFVVISGIKPGGIAYGLRRIDLMVVDDHGIATQTLYRGSEALGSAAGSTLSLAWDTHSVADGPCALHLDVLDTGGNLGRCDITFSVDNSIDRDPPQLREIRVNYEGESGLRTFEINAEDDQALAYIALRLDDVEVARSNSSPLRFTLDPQKFEDGMYRATYIVEDASGKQDMHTDYVFVERDDVPRYTVSGRVLAPNGDPLPNCRVEIWRGAEPYDSAYHAVFDSATTDAAGRFTLENVAPGTHPLTIESRLILSRQDLVITGDIELPAASTTLRTDAGPGMQVARLAVVTGAEEGLEDFLAKLGFGETDSQGRLIRGTEHFTLIDGDNSLPDGTYANCDEFFRQSFEDTPYDQLLIAAGNHYEDLLLSDIAFRDGLSRWHAVAPSTRFLRDYYLGGSAYDYFVYSPQLQYYSEIYFSGENYQLDWPLPLDAAQIGPAVSELRLSLPDWAEDRNLGQRQQMLDWLADRGFEPEEDGSYAAGPLAAGWVVTCPNYHLPGQVLAYADIDRGAGIEPWRLQITCDGLIYSALPVPKQPSPGFSLQERLLEYALFAERR